jgi:hypothetical protein
LSLGEPRRWPTDCLVPGSLLCRPDAPDRDFQVCPPGGQHTLANMTDLIPGAGLGWETALLLPVLAAEPAVGQQRARLDEAARDGVPAHITVLYPFLPPAGIGERLLKSLGKLVFAAAPSWPPSGGDFP